MELGKALGFDRVVCTHASWSAAGNLDGKLLGQNCYGVEKVRQLQMIFGEDRAGWRVHAYSDHHSDLPLILWSDVRVAVNPTRLLKSKAREHNIEIVAWD